MKHFLSLIKLYILSVICSLRGHPAKPLLGGGAWCARCQKLLIHPMREKESADVQIHGDEPKTIRSSANVHFVLKPGFDWNPLLKYPSNLSCWCGSGKKAKRCCLPKTRVSSPTIDREQAEILRRYLRDIGAKT